MSSKSYDPLGILSSVTLVAHRFIAELWEEKFGWDQPLPPSKVATWQHIEKGLHAASQFHFKGWIKFDKTEPASLHVFTDASKSAFGVTAYLTQGTSIFLIGSKSKLVSRSKRQRLNLQTCRTKPAGALSQLRLPFSTEYAHAQTHSVPVHTSMKSSTLGGGGGVYERFVRLTKSTLKKVIGRSLFS